MLGAIVGKVRNVPFTASVEDLATSLTPGSSMLVAVVEHRWVQQLEDMVAGLGAQVLREELKADIAEQLDAGGNVAFSFGASEEGMAAGRVAEHADGSAEVAGFLASADGILLTEAELTSEELPAAPEPEGDPQAPDDPR